MQNLIIDRITIRRDSEGRYCLNDLHKASGGERKNEPSLFLTNKQTQELIQELSVTGNPVSDKINNLEPIKIIRGFGVEQGTYVVEDLVYAYAMWISAAFNLKVIRTFRALTAQQEQRKQPDPKVNQENSLLSVTSLEIAEILNMEHLWVHSRIRTLICIDQIGEVSIEKDGTENIYVFKGEHGKRDSLILVVDMRPEYVPALLNHWQTREQKALLSHPTVNVYELLDDMDGMVAIKDAARFLNKNNRELEQWLLDHKWIRKGSVQSPWLGSDQMLFLDYLRHKVEPKQIKGLVHFNYQILITAKGLKKLSHIFGFDGLPVHINQQFKNELQLR